MSHTLESYLVELFPETKYSCGGLDNNKWVTKYYEFNFRNNYFKNLTTNEIRFVKPGDWKATINRLKIVSNGKEGNPIV
jgi:hypothetical protein